MPNLSVTARSIRSSRSVTSAIRVAQSEPASEALGYAR
jgi:hypothetical protein